MKYRYIDFEGNTYTPVNQTITTTKKWHLYLLKYFANLGRLYVSDTYWEAESEQEAITLLYQLQKAGYPALAYKGVAPKGTLLCLELGTAELNKEIH
jgi:hypothetical protein